MEQHHINDSNSLFQSLKSPHAQLRDAAALILDEIIMLHQYNTEALDQYLNALMNNDLLFGGKIVIVAGDGRQTLPIEC